MHRTNILVDTAFYVLLKDNRAVQDLQCHVNLLPDDHAVLVPTFIMERVIVGLSGRRAHSRDGDEIGAHGLQEARSVYPCLRSFRGREPRAISDWCPVHHV